MRTKGKEAINLRVGGHGSGWGRVPGVVERRKEGKVMYFYFN